MTIYFFFNDTATTEIYTLSLHDALPIFVTHEALGQGSRLVLQKKGNLDVAFNTQAASKFCQIRNIYEDPKDRKSTRLNSSHANISYAVFCLKKKKTPNRY